MLLITIGFLLLAETPADSSLAADSVAASRWVDRGVVARAGDHPGRVVEPAGVASDAFGRLWVTDAQLHRVLRFAADGRWLGETGVLGSDAGELRRPAGVAPLGAANMAVLDQGNRRILVYDLFGRLQGTRVDLADPEVESVTDRVDPSGMAADRGGALYVADPARERVLVFDASGRLSRTLGGFGARVGFFRGLQGLAVAPRGELVVVERLNARVQRLDAGGRPAGSWPLAIEPRATGVLAVAVDQGGRVAVTDESRGRLWVFDAGGRLLAARGGLGRPRAVTFAPDGSLLIAEAEPAQVRRLAVVAPGED